METKSRKIGTETFQIGIIIFLIAILVALSLNPNLVNTWKSAPKTYSLELIKVEGCPECMDLSSITKAFSNNPNLKIKKEVSYNYNSPEAQKLMEKYEIKTVPALIVSSKYLDQVLQEESLFKVEKNTAIFEKAVPYLVLSSGKIVGEIIVQEIYDPSCIECTNLTALPAQLEKSGIKIKSTERISSASPEGKELIQLNQPTFLPALLLSKDVSEYWWVFPQLEDQLLEKEKSYLLTLPFFPAKELSSGKVKGKVTVTYLTADNCTNCFQAKELKPLFQSLGIYFAQETEIKESSNDGKNLIKKYNLTKVPTIIFSAEIMDYGESQKNVLQKIGTFELDDTFVLRGLDLLQVKYKELSLEN